MERVPLGADDAELVRMLGREAAATMLAGLPPDQRAAVNEHVVDGRAYAEIAGRHDVSEPVVRQRVSRGLSALRQRMGGTR
jgi:RNA polymerase sigma-70 factor (ECF subfamily)